MSVEKTYLYSSSSITGMQKLYDFLQANAVPEYFDSVQKESSGVKCYIGSHDFFFFGLAQGADKGIKIKQNNGSVLTLQTSGYMYMNYGYKCANGLSFSIIDGSTANKQSITFTKDDSGNTVVITTSNLKISSSNTLYVINASTGNTISKTFACADNCGCTSLAPLVVGDTPNYTPNAFLIPFAQNISECILHIDGIKYLSNGLWCIKDE